MDNQIQGDYGIDKTASWLKDDPETQDSAGTEDKLCSWLKDKPVVEPQVEEAKVGEVASSELIPEPVPPSVEVEKQLPNVTSGAPAENCGESIQGVPSILESDLSGSDRETIAQRAEDVAVPKPQDTTTESHSAGVTQSTSRGSTAPPPYRPPPAKAIVLCKVHSMYRRVQDMEEVSEDSGTSEWVCKPTSDCIAERKRPRGGGDYAGAKRSRFAADTPRLGRQGAMDKSFLAGNPLHSNPTQGVNSASYGDPYQSDYEMPQQPHQHHHHHMLHYHNHHPSWMHQMQEHFRAMGFPVPPMPGTPFPEVSGNGTSTPEIGSKITSALQNLGVDADSSLIEGLISSMRTNKAASPPLTSAWERDVAPSSASTPTSPAGSPTIQQLIDALREKTARPRSPVPTAAPAPEPEPEPEPPAHATHQPSSDSNPNPASLSSSRLASLLATMKSNTSPPSRALSPASGSASPPPAASPPPSSEGPTPGLTGNAKSMKKSMKNILGLLGKK